MTEYEYERACQEALAEYKQVLTAIEAEYDVVRHPAEVAYTQSIRAARTRLVNGTNPDAAEWRRLREAATAEYIRTCALADERREHAVWSAYFRYRARHEAIMADRRACRR